MQPNQLLETLVDTATTEGDTRRVVMLGSPSTLGAAQLVSALHEAGIEVTTTERPDDGYNGFDFDTIEIKSAPNGCPSNHFYANGYIPREEKVLDTNRKQFRDDQATINKKNGYGKRLTKKDRG